MLSERERWPRRASILQPPQELFSLLQLGLLLSSSLYGAQEATEDPLTVLHSSLGTALVGDTEDVRGSLSEDFTGVPDSGSGLKVQYAILFCQIQKNSPQGPGIVNGKQT